MRVYADRKNSPVKISSPSKKQAKQQSSDRKRKDRIISDSYFCHHSNAVYMGGANSFQKQGQGILLMDDGTCIIANHSRDNMLGHNVLMGQNQILSLIIDHYQNKSIVYRSDNYLLFFNMNKDQQIKGKVVLIDYYLKEIFKMNFKKMKVDQKSVIKDTKLLRQVFQLKSLQGIIEDERHLNVLNFDFNDLICNPQIVQVVQYEQLDAQQFMIGFFQSSGPRHAGIHKNGLVFQVRTSNIMKENFKLKIIERGCYQNGKRHLFGEKHFNNGNLYIGEFNKGLQQGLGVLYDTKEQQWVYGYYKNGKFTQIKYSSMTNKSDRKSKQLPQVLTQIHSYSRQYIKKKIIVEPSLQFLRKLQKYLIEEIDQDPEHRKNRRLNSYPFGSPLIQTYESEQKQIKNQEEKQKMMTDIYNAFTQGSCDTRTKNTVRKILENQQYNHQNQRVSEFTLSKQKKRVRFQDQVSYQKDDVDSLEEKEDRNQPENNTFPIPEYKRNQIDARYTSSYLLGKYYSPTRSRSRSYGKVKNPQDSSKQRKKFYEFQYLKSPRRTKLTSQQYSPTSKFIPYSTKPQPIERTFMQKSNNILKTTYKPSEEWYRNMDEKKQRLSSNSLKKRVHGNNYHYDVSEQQEDRELYKRISRNKKYRGTEQIKRSYRKSPSKYH